jgi:hypothetical protein
VPGTSVRSSLPWGVSGAAVNDVSSAIFRSDSIVDGAKARLLI